MAVLALLESAFTTEGNKTLLAVLTAPFVTEKNDVLREIIFSLDVFFSVLLIVPVYDEWPDISTVKSMSNKCGMYERILSAFRSF